MFLQDSLGGNAKSLIVCNVSPAAAHAQETLSTLQFASRAKRIQTHAVVNEDAMGSIEALRAEIRRLHR
jgi:hypothetical protein